MATKKLDDLRRSLLTPSLCEFNLGVDLYARVRHHLDPVEQEGLAALMIVMRKRMGPLFGSHRMPTASERVLAMRAACRGFGALRREEVELQGWGVEEMPEEVGQLVCRKLTISANPLRSLPESFGAITPLRILHASTTQLDALPASFAALRLTDLSISHGQFTQFPAQLLAMPTLTTLDLSANPLARLPDELTGCTQLTWLSLHHTPLTTLPPGLERLTQLKTLHLGDTPLVQSGQLEEIRQRLPWCEVTNH